MLFADLRRDFVKTWFTPLDDASFADMDSLFSAMENQGAADLARGRNIIAEFVV